MKYKFEEELIEGLIKSRPNRFLMNVKIGNKIHLCHCPSTGRIGNLVFENIPCLLSKSLNESRKTKYTVEAISLEKVNSKRKKWIGINQTKMNRYVEFFIKNGELKRMISGKNVQRERKLGNSRIDFLVDEVYLEVKMPLISLPTANRRTMKNISKFDSFGRLIKHFDELRKYLKNGKRAIVLLTYMYDAKPFVRPKTDDTNLKILKSAKRAQKFGVENWQANFKIDKRGVDLINYFKLDL